MTATAELDDITRAQRWAERQRRRNRPAVPVHFLGSIRATYRSGVTSNGYGRPATDWLPRCAGWQAVRDTYARCIAEAVVGGRDVPGQWLTIYRAARDRAAYLSR